MRRATVTGPTTARKVVSVLVALTVLGTAGCTPGHPGPEPSATPSVTPSASVTATQEATPSPTPEPQGAVDRTDAELGITFSGLLDVEDDARAALDAYTLFEVEHWRALLAGEVHDQLRLLASPEALATLENQVAGNAEGGWTVGGSTGVEVLDVEAGADVAVVHACLDPRASTFTNDEGTRSGEDYGMAASVVVAELGRSGAGWTVERYDVSGGEPC